MRKISVAMTAALALVAYGTLAATDAVRTVEVRSAMVEGVNPAALAIWGVGNDATDDDGMPEASRLDPDQVASVKEWAQLLAVYSRSLAESDTILASGPDLVGGKVPEGVATREQIQAAIDADPAGFRLLAKAMGREADEIIAAVDRADQQAVAELVVRFDGACQSCHERYWYVD